MPGRVQYEPDQSQRHGRARSGTGHREGRQVPLAARLTRLPLLRPIIGILLAAGSGSRFGGDKLSARLDSGLPLGVAALHTLIPAVDAAVAVMRPGGDALAVSLREAGARVTICEAANAGM